MKTIRLFLASSKELKAEREYFEQEIGRKNKLWHEKDFFLHLDIWEDLSARMQPSGSQSGYNEYVRQCDLVILLAYTKIGMYTEEEFETAFGQFQAKEKPFIFTYFKETEGNTDPSLQSFKDRLNSLKHFYASFADCHDLWNQFNKELDRLLLAGFVKNEWQRGIKVNNQGAEIKNQFNGGTFNNPTFN